MYRKLSVIAIALSALTIQAQDSTQARTAPIDPPHREWHAAWVTHPTAPLREPLVLHFSQQANILGVLYDVIPKDQQREVLRRMMAIEPGTTPNGILSASYYFRFYLARALEHAGMADDYLSSIEPWRQMLALHFSTWPEVPGDTRSDSHAWSAHPIYDLLTLVAGIEPASPGFATVRIAPHLGALPELKATYPHPDGIIAVNYLRTKDGLDATVTLPGKLTGTFVFNGRTWPLAPGVNHIESR